MAVLTTRGSWQLDVAIVSQWQQHSLDAAFRRESVDVGATEYVALCDEYAMPSPPGPYCVYQKEEPQIIARMTGSDVTQQKEVVAWPFRLTVFAKSTSSEDGKSIAQRLATKVAGAFDPHNAVQTDDNIHVLTIRRTDYHYRQGYDVWSWSLEYMFIVDQSLQAQRAVDGTVTPAPSDDDNEEIDDVLDFGDIGGVYGDQAQAVENTLALNTYLATRANAAVSLTFRGPASYNDTKREPQDVYLDMSSTIPLNVGGSGKVTDLVFSGPSKLIGVNAGSATTPLFTITRSAGTTPQITFKDMQIETDGSGIKIVNGGSGLLFDNVKIVDFTGNGSIDHDDWTDIDASTFSYGIWVDEADGAVFNNLQIVSGSGHGFVASRMHAGRLDARARELDGVGFKLERCNGTVGRLWAESNDGYGLHARQCGIDRYVDGAKAGNNYGTTNDWEVWFEANNARGTAHNRAGYAFSQFKLESTSRIRMTGHSGWRVNQGRMARLDRVRNELIEERHTTVSQNVDLELVTDNIVNGTVALPDATNSNWSTIWTNALYRPTAAIVGDGTADDPERIRITWPADSFDNVDVQQTAYWRPFNDGPLVSPAGFYFMADVKDVDGAIAAYCIAREAVAANRQTPRCAGFGIAPIGAAVTSFSLWDQQRRIFTGGIDIDDSRSDIQPELHVFFAGMSDAESGTENSAPQSTSHVMDIYQLRLYRIA